MLYYELLFAPLKNVPCNLCILIDDGRVWNNMDDPFHIMLFRMM